MSVEFSGSYNKLFEVLCWTCELVFGLKTGSETIGQAREDLPIYKFDLPDPIFGVPELKKGNLRAKNH